MQNPGWNELYKVLAQTLAYTVAALAGVALTRFKDWIDRKKKQISISKVIDQSLTVRECLIELRTKIDCDVTILLQIKNGIYYSSGESEQKVTVTHVAPRFGHGIDPVLVRAFSEVPISLISRSLQEVLKGGYYIPRMHDMVEDSFLKQIFMGIGAESVHLAPVYNKTGNLIAIIIASWFDRPEALEPEHRAHIENAQQRMALLIAKR